MKANSNLKSHQILWRNGAMNPASWGRAFICRRPCCALLPVWQYSRGVAAGWIMSVRALLYRRPSEPSVVQVIFDQAIYPVRMRRHRQARRYTLRIDAASREVVLTIPPRGSLKEAREFEQKHGAWIAARLERLPQATPFARGVVVPLRGVPHRIVHRSDVRGTVWTEQDRDGG